MGTVKQDSDRGRHLADLLCYDAPASLKQALRYLRRLQARAELGCPTSQAIVVDLKSALGCYRTDSLAGRWVLTQRQREAIQLHLVDDRSVQEVARLLGVDPTAISHRVNSGLRRMVGFLNTEPGDPSSRARHIRKREQGETRYA